MKYRLCNRQMLILIFALILSCFILILTSTQVYADETTAAGELTLSTSPADIDGLGGSGNASEELEEFVTGENGFLNIVAQAGMVLVAFGVGQMILAFKDDNPDAKARGVMVLLAGVFCVTIKLILNDLGVGI